MEAGTDYGYALMTNTSAYAFQVHERVAIGKLNLV